MGRGLGVRLGRAVDVGLAVAVGVAEGVALGVVVAVAGLVAVAVALGVVVAVTVGVGVGVALGGAVGVGVHGGPWHPKVLTVSTRQPSLAPLASLAIRQRKRTSRKNRLRLTTLVTKPPELPLQAMRPAIGLPRSVLIVRL